MGMGVTITIDRMPIIEVTIVRTDTFRDNDEEHKYLVRYLDQRYTITHKYSDGAVELAKKALDRIEYNYIPDYKHEITS
jgi:hypothetical protein